ncbi:MAG TPA: hypothetical protein VLV83_11455 [Acidobacteriota bacterium]|nr:hypothetical protein [Acidobacteriota bacterium]
MIEQRTLTPECGPEQGFLDPAFQPVLPRILPQLALLTGLGDRSQEAARKAVAGLGQAGARTCIDGGSRLLLSLRAEASASRKVSVLTPLASPDGSQRALWEQRWMGPGCLPKPWRIEAFPPQGEAWKAAREAARASSRLERLQQLQARLGPLGSIRFVARSSSGTGCWIGWQLDRSSGPLEALRSCGLEDLWTPASRLFGLLLGRPPRPRSRPWSLALWLSPEEESLRLGTSLWGFQPEDAAKRVRLRRTVEEVGGDACFLEAAYKLLAAARPRQRRRACLGRAAELEIRNENITGLEIFLRPLAA